MKDKVLVEISARHAHLTDEHLEILFGEGHELTYIKELSQPGQYACEERVKIVGPRGEQDRVIILGPTRDQTQVEMSATDARSLGIEGHIRMSGDIAGSGACKIVGPKGEIDIDEGVIIAKRHIHLNPQEAEHFDVKDGEVVSVAVESEDRSLTFGDVVIRVNENFSAAMHIDTDEGNAASVGRETYGTIIKNQ